jgi:hypothetical protein
LTTSIRSAFQTVLGLNVLAATISFTLSLLLRNDLLRSSATPVALEPGG